MAVLRVSSNGNWTTCNGGSPPNSGDIICLDDGVTLTLNQASGSTYTNSFYARVYNSLGTNTTGKLAIGSGAVHNIAGDLKAGKSNALLTVTTGKTINVTGNIYGGSDTPSAEGAAGVVVDSGGTLGVTGNIYGGGNYSNASTSPGVDLNGTLTGAIALISAGVVTAGLRVNNNATITATITKAIGATLSAIGFGINDLGNVSFSIGTVEGGGYAGAHGYMQNSSSSHVVTVGVAKGGSVSGAYGVYITNYFGGSNFVVVQAVDLTGVEVPVGCSQLLGLRSCPGMMLASKDLAGTGTALFAETSGVAPANKVISGTSRYTGGAAGTYVEPVVGQVLAPAQGGTAYGAASAVGGTLTQPDAQYVLSTCPDYGVAGSGGAKTATIPTAVNTRHGTGAFGVGGSGTTPICKVPTAANVQSGVPVDVTDTGLLWIDR